MARAGGIEPPHAGIKIRCLTAWRRPSRAGPRWRGPPYKASRASPQTVQRAAPTRACSPVAGAGGHRYKGASRGEGATLRDWYRRVAQPGRALRSGRRGRRFESSLSDHFFKQILTFLDRCIWPTARARAWGRYGVTKAGTRPPRLFDIKTQRHFANETGSFTMTNRYGRGDALRREPKATIARISLSNSRDHRITRLTAPPNTRRSRWSLN